MGTNATKEVIFHDDLTDSDNWIAARALFLATCDDPNVRVHWIIEPRAFRMGLTCDETKTPGCKRLIEQYFPECCESDPKGAIKLLLRGKLTKDEIDERVKEKAHREILYTAIKPQAGPPEDSELHGRLTAYDFLASLTEWTEAEGRQHGRRLPMPRVLLDREAAKTNHNLVNLNYHHHEELVARTVKELDEYDKLMTEPVEIARVQGLRGWYRGCIDKAQSRGGKVEDLDRKELLRIIRKTKGNVMFFGGASLGLLDYVTRKSKAEDVKRIECYLQHGAFDLENNIFGNQFNMVLDLDASRRVFASHDKYAKFVTSPTDTTQRVKYSIGALSENGGEAMAKRFIGYNVRKCARDIAEGKKEATVEEHKSEVYSMPDLTAWLCGLLESKDFKDWVEKPARLVYNEKDGSMPFSRDNGVFMVREIEKEGEVLVTDAEVATIFAKLRGTIRGPQP